DRWADRPAAGDAGECDVVVLDPPRTGARREVEREIAKGLLPEEAANVVGASQAVGGRWFRHGGGMSPLDTTAFSGRYSVVLGVPARRSGML
ncbi:MAG: hypothetical protein ACXWW7_10645, partial [Nocardioides sp.]